MNEFDASKCKYYYKHTKICLTRSDYMCRYKNCSDVPAKDCYYKQLQQLKAENEKLKEKLERLLCSDNCYRLQPYKQCLDEIEKLQKELCRRCEVTFCGNTVCYEILQKIKEVKSNV